MNILNNYKKFLEKVQADFFQKNPDFYLSNTPTNLKIKHTSN